MYCANTKSFIIERKIEMPSVLLVTVSISSRKTGLISSSWTQTGSTNRKARSLRKWCSCEKQWYVLSASDVAATHTNEQKQPDLIIFTMDASIGQAAFAQASAFKQVVSVGGII